MKTMYRVRWNDIQPVKVASETDSFITLAGQTRKEKKRTDWQSFFDTERLAAEYILQNHESDVTRLKHQLSNAEELLANARASLSSKLV